MRIRTWACWSVVAAAAVAAPGVAIGCGGSDDDSGSEPPQTADEVRANLEDAGYLLGEDVTEGGTEGLAGNVDADVLFGVNAGPDGNSISSASVYFFATEEDAQTYASESERGDCAFDCAYELRDSHVYSYAGSDAADLDPIVAAGEGGD
jgi:hypothetical protein